MLRLIKHVLVVVLFVVFAGCSGGGCTSGCSCAGVTPLPAGFPPEKRVENAAAVRLTDSGLNFLEQNLGSIAGLVLGDMGMGGIVTFEVPPTSQDLFVADADICPNGPNPAANPPECVAEIDLANAQLSIDTTSPHNIHVYGPLPVRIQKLPLKVTWFGFLEDNLEMVFNQGGNCPGAGQPFGTVGVDVQVSIEIDSDMTHSRYGYSRVRIGGFSINEDDILANIEYCDQNGVTGDILDALDSFFIGTLVDQITGTLQSSIEEQLCQRANPDLNPPCPDGTLQDGDYCRYGDGSCASIILGLEGNIDLSGLLASFSPGTKGGFDFLLAAGGHSVRDDGSTFHYGDLNPIGAGATLGMYGGTEPVPVSGCVPQVAVEPPQGIPIPDELVANTLPDWPAGTEGPHVGFAISERFTNYMLTQLYNSGALCLGITPDALGPAVPLATSLVSVGLGAPSMEELGRLKESAPIAILLRPQAPPQATFGNGTDIETDPLIRLVLPKLSFDFYVWSLDRYIRMMTATMDLDVPINLTVTPEGLVPEVQQLTVSNASVTNSQLLREDPAALAASLQALLGDLIGGFLGDVFPPISLNDALSSLGLTLEIPPSVEGQGSPGLRKLEKGRDRYLGFFGTIGFAPTMMSVSNPPPMPEKPPISETTAELIDLHVDPAGLRIDGYGADNGPKARIYAGSNLDNGGYAIEWQYKLDKGPWRPFTRERWIDIHDEWLRGQGVHLVHVRSRIVGETHSLDPEPAVVELIVDAEPPRIAIDQNAQGMLEVRAVDAVSGASRTRMRLRLGEGATGDVTWAAWSEWMEADDLPALDVEADWVEVEALDEEGHVATSVQPLLRGRADAEGCSCTTPGRSGDEHGRWLLFAALFALVIVRRKRLPVPVAGAMLVLFGGMSGCSCGDDVASTDTCRGRGDCEVVLPGLIGAYGSAVVGSDGKLWVAGYLEASYDQDFFFGDLVVGTWNGSQVDWKAIDGVPADPPVDPQRFDPQGFRGGQTEQGDDVGLWTSIAIAPDGNPAVAYYDATNRALRFAQRGPDGAWQVGEVQRVERGDVGRYAKLAFIGGQAHIAYLFIEPGEAGAVKSGVRLARGGGGWSFEDVVVDNATPCRHYFCGPGTACVIDTGICTDESNDCAAACADGEECVDIGGMPTCSAIYDTGKLDTYPDAVGLYISLAQRPNGELAIGYYDRVHGNLMIAVQSGGMWTSQVVDGEANGTDTGDKGIGASLYVDKDDVFHMSYVDGLSESLNYVAMPGGTAPGAVEVVDDGLSAGDGPHLVGDDSHIFVQPSGEVHISYQDATAGLLRVAIGTASSGSHTWTTETVEQQGFAGFFSRQIEFEGGVKVLNFWRVASPKAEGNVRVLSP